MIEIQNLHFGYGSQSIFQNISLTFQPGNIYGLLGENGVGKTTLLKIISGLQAPKQGSCKVGDSDSFRRLPSMLEDLFFMCDAVELPSHATPENYFKQLSPFYPKSSDGLFLDLMNEMEVDPKKKFKEMSLGQQKKSLIAAALSFGTSYILLDEPTNGLDIPSKAKFRKVLSRRVDENTTIIISTHQVKDVENLIDPIIILSNNDVLLNANIEQITQKLAFVYNTEALPGSLYSELQPNGYLNVIQNFEGTESQVNIEALFNAVHNNKSLIKNLFE